MSTNPSGVPNAGGLYLTEVPLRERLSEDLKRTVEKHEGTTLMDVGKTDFEPDLLFRSGEQLVFVEVKTGDPSLPLPSSANAQMLILKDTIQERHKSTKITPVLVTNYSVDDADRKELLYGGIKVVTIHGSSYDTKELSEELVKIINP